MNTTRLNSVNLSPTALNSVRLNCIGVEGRKREKVDYIKFADSAVEAICLANFDTNGDGKIQFSEAYDADSFYELFHNNTSVKVIDKLEYFSNIKTLYRAFKGCSALETIGINSMDTSNVTTIYSLFSGDGKLKEIDMSNMNLSKVTDMQWAFNKCASLVALNMSGVELTSCTTAYKAFEGCVALANFSIGSMPKADVSFAASSQLSAQSVENIINALSESAGNSVTLHSDAISRYDALHGEDACEDAIIGKGWTLVYA